MGNQRQFSFVTLKKSRKMPQPGQIFVYQLVAEPELFRYGMVVSLDTYDGEPLVYLYKATSSDKMKIPKLSNKELLVGPVPFFRYLWSDGIFENVGKVSIDDVETLPYHVFLEIDWKKTGDGKQEKVETKVDEKGIPTSLPFVNPSPIFTQSDLFLEHTILPILGYEASEIGAQEPDFTTTEIEPEPYPELTAEQTETARELVTTFYNDMEKIARYYDDIDDTVVRENIAWILSHGFVWGEPVRQPILNVGMFSKRGNERVGKALADLFAAANASEVIATIPLGQARLDILQDSTIETKKGEPYDAFIGHSDKLHKYSELKDWLFEKYTDSWP